MVIEKRFSTSSEREYELHRSEPNGTYWIVIKRPIPNNPMSWIIRKCFKTEKRAREVFNK